MNQESFNLTHPVSHRNGPETEKLAERSITDSGKRRSDNEKVAWLVARYPGLTASELLARARQVENDHLFPQVDIYTIRRRLSDMNGIHVRRGEKHEARIGLLRNKESVWFPK